MPCTRHPALPGVVHPSFTRITPTSYFVRDPEYPMHTTIHVGQITEYLQFDEQLRAYHHDAADFTSIPIGFSEFSTTWNEGAIPGDPRRISTVTLADDPRNNSIVPSTHPVHLYEFHITPAQAGVAYSTTEQPPTTLQADINQEFAALMVARQKRQRQYYEERQEKKTRAFSFKRLVLPPPVLHEPFRRHHRKRHRKSHQTSPPSTSLALAPIDDGLQPVNEDLEAENLGSSSSSTIPEDPFVLSNSIMEVFN